jgi:hypothetical protein
VELRIIKDAGHFFDDQLDELKRVITEWALSEPPAVAAVNACHFLRSFAEKVTYRLPR